MAQILVSRERFKFAPRQCRSKEDTIRVNALSESLKCKDTHNFGRVLKNDKYTHPARLQGS